MMDADREKFRSYVEKSGLMSALKNALINLYEEPEKPVDPLDYIKTALGTTSAAEKKLEILQEKIEALEKENQNLKEQLEAALATNSAGEKQPTVVSTAAVGDAAPTEEQNDSASAAEPQGETVAAAVETAPLSDAQSTTDATNSSTVALQETQDTQS